MRGPTDEYGVPLQPARAPGPRKGLIIFVASVGCLALAGWLVIPLSSWFGSWGLGEQTEKPLPQTPAPAKDRMLDGLPKHYVPNIVAEAAEPPRAPSSMPVTPTDDPRMGMLEQQYHALLQQFEQLKGSLKTPVTQAVPHQKADPAADERKKTREAFGKSVPIMLARHEEDAKVSQVHALKSPYSLAPLTLIPCETEMEVSSDIPGAFRAMVTSDVHASGVIKHVVIPQGSELGLQPAGQTIFGDSRIRVEVSVLKFPNGHWVKFGPATVTDRQGTTGFTGDIDRHWGRLFASILLTGVLRGGTTIATAGAAGGAGAIGSAIVQDASNQGQQQTRQFMRTDPTITVPQNYGCMVQLHDELVLSQAYEVAR